MVDEISPTIEAPAEEAKPEPVVNEQMSEETQLLERLRAASLDKPEKLDGAIRNADRTFEMQSERDKLANELAAMREQMAQVPQHVPPPKPVEDYDTGYENAQPIDIQAEIRKGIKADRDEQARQQAMIQKRQMKSWNTIQSDKHFKQVEPIWSEKLKDPNFVYGVQSGQIDPVLEYMTVKSEYFEGLMRSSVSTIENLQKGGAPQVHVESGDARTTTLDPDVDLTAQEEIIKKLRDKADSGKVLSEDEELQLIGASLSK